MRFRLLATTLTVAAVTVFAPVTPALGQEKPPFSLAVVKNPQTLPEKLFAAEVNANSAFYVLEIVGRTRAIDPTNPEHESKFNEAVGKAEGAFKTDYQRLLPHAKTADQKSALKDWRLDHDAALGEAASRNGRMTADTKRRISRATAALKLAFE